MGALDWIGLRRERGGREGGREGGRPPGHWIGLDWIGEGVSRGGGYKFRVTVALNFWPALRCT